MRQAIHPLDLFQSLVGVREVVAAQETTTSVHQMETEDFVTALVRLGNDAHGSVAATTAAYPGGPERIEMMGTCGAASLVGGSLRLAMTDGCDEKTSLWRERRAVALAS